MSDTLLLIEDEPLLSAELVRHFKRAGFEVMRADTLVEAKRMLLEDDVQPLVVVSELMSTKTSAIVVVDNCSPEHHRALADTCRAAGSTVSLLTIEYDIQDDLPEGTDVYKMDAPTVDMTEKLLLKRFSMISQVDARTAASFVSSDPASDAVSMPKSLKIICVRPADPDRHARART